MANLTSKLSPKEIFWVSLGLLVLLLVWFWELFTLKVGFISGDHRVQHYPWMYYLASELKQGRFPLWTNLIGCGFPIFAEGQIAALYPFNLLFYGLLPFKFAYNYLTLFHYLLGGIFFYCFCRILSISRWGASIASFIYLFSSSQGGYFYNMNSQKTCIWFPLVLLLMEQFFRKKNWLFLLWLGIIFAIQINAGYLQIAFYSLAFAFFYFFLRSVFLTDNPAGAGKRFTDFLWQSFLMSTIAIVLSLPQILATYELSQFSSRVNLPESFAYVGSLTPQNFITLLFPFLDGYLGVDFYLGIFTLFLVFSAWFNRKDWSVSHWALFWAALLALLIALGQFSPLYIAIVKLTHFYGFRVPSKVLYFFVFGTAVLAGFGWDRLICHSETVRLKNLKAAKVFLILLGIGLLFAVLGAVVIKQLLPLLKSLGTWILNKYYVGNPLHPHSLNVYLERLDELLNLFIKNISLGKSFWMRIWTLLVSLNFLWGVSFLVFSKKGKSLLLGLGICLLVVDLFAYGFTSIRPNGRPYQEYLAPTKPFVNVLREDKSQYRIYEYSLDLFKEEKFPLIYNYNMLYGISDVGVYAPLATEYHRNFFRGLGANSNSISVSLADPLTFTQLRPLLDVSNVKYLLGCAAPPGKDWVKRFTSGEFSLYQNKKVLPRAFWLPAGDALIVEDFNKFAGTEDFHPEKQLIFERKDAEGVSVIERGRSGSYRDVRIERDEPGLLWLSIKTPAKGWVFVSDSYYPGWSAKVDGKPAKIIKANGIFRAVMIDSGAHKIEFVYNPFYKNWFWVSLSVLIGIILLSFLFAIKQRSKD